MSSVQNQPTLSTQVGHSMPQQIHQVGSIDGWPGQAFSWGTTARSLHLNRHKHFINRETKQDLFLIKHASSNHSFPRHCSFYTSSAGYHLVLPGVAPVFMWHGATVRPLPLPLPSCDTLNEPLLSKLGNPSHLWSTDLCLISMNALKYVVQLHAGLFPPLPGMRKCTPHSAPNFSSGLQQHTRQVLAQERMHPQPYEASICTPASSSSVRKQCWPHFGPC